MGIDHWEAVPEDRSVLRGGLTTDYADMLRLDSAGFSVALRIEMAVNLVRLFPLPETIHEWRFYDRHHFRNS